MHHTMMTKKQQFYHQSSPEEEEAIGFQISKLHTFQIKIRLDKKRIMQIQTITLR